MFKVGDSMWNPNQRDIGLDRTTFASVSILGFIRKVLRDWSLTLAALLAYAFLIALLPIVITASGIFALVIRNSIDTRWAIINSTVDSLSNVSLKESVREISHLAADQLSNDASGIIAIGVVLSAWGGSRLFVAIDKVFTIVYRTRSRSFVLQNLLAFGMLIIFVFLVVIIFGTGAIPAFLINVFPAQKGAQFGFFLAGIIVSMVAAFILFILIYLIVPNREIKLKHAWMGALFASILLDVFVILFPLYVRRFMGSFLGLFGFAVILVAFFYYLSVILIMGAQINVYFFDRVQPLPHDLGTHLSQSSVTKMPPEAPPAYHHHNHYRPPTGRLHRYQKY